MGHLIELVKLNTLVFGDLPTQYKTNTLEFLDRYKRTDEQVKAIRLQEIKAGMFYFLHYLDDSNWIRYSPVFVIDFKKFGNLIVLNCINLNFIPLQVRPLIFDPYIKEKDFDNKNFFLKTKYEIVYKELKKFGFQWSIMEYNVAQVQKVHRISFDVVAKFLFSGHPKAKYDPAKLIQIWKKKFIEQDKRDQEMMQANIQDFYDMSGEISEKYDMLKNHVQRIQRSAKKYGGR